MHFPTVVCGWKVYSNTALFCSNYGARSAPMWSSICTYPNASLCCNAASATSSASSRGSWRSEKIVGVSKVTVECISSPRVSNATVRAAAATTTTIQKANYGLAATYLSSRLVPLSAAARRRRRASFELGGDSHFDDDWALDNFEDTDYIEEDGVASGRIRKSSSHGELELGCVRSVEKVDDWAEKARQRAVLLIQERGLPVTGLLEERRRKKKKKNRKKKQTEDAKLDKTLTTDNRRKFLAPRPGYVEPPLDNPLLSSFGSGEGLKELAGLGVYWKSLGQTAEIRIQQDDRPKEVELLIQDNSELVEPGLKSRFSKGASSASSRQRRQEDFDLNRRLVEASSAKDVLFVVSSALEISPWGQGEYLLSPMNISTALHRISKHMEAESMHKSDRLSFARQKTMALLVSAAMESLPRCSAQSIANIAWALSKVGGSSLYWAELDLLAQAAMSRISDLEPQHVANIAGAFASMQHSAPLLFKTLDQRACSLHRDFQSQEFAQLLWAFATLNETAKLLLEALDTDCETSDHATHTKLSGSVQLGDEPSTTWTSVEVYFSSFTLSELCSLSWSYTVLNELKRPSFGFIWKQIVERSQGDVAEVQEMAGRSMQLSQLYQVSLSLELEYPELNLRPGETLGALAKSEWEKLKVGKKSTSITQKDVETLLVSTGRQWVGEYSAASHSLDLALVEERIVLEIDGPTHFSRNTGTALGHTVLKRRQLSAAGWTVFSIPYLEWDELLGEEEQMEYLRDLLKNHL